MKKERGVYISEWIFNSFRVTKEGLGLFRIFTALFILLFLLPSFEVYELLGHMPPDFYSPPVGPMRLFNTFPSVEIFGVMHGILVLSLVGLLVGFKTPWSSLIAGISLLVIKGFIYSLGKINHELLIPVVLIAMAYSGWGAIWSFDSRSIKTKRISVHSWPVTLIALILGFMMFTAGFPKVLGGWLDLDTHAVLSRFAREFFVKNRQDLLAEYALQIKSSIIWEGMDYFTVIFELGFLVAIMRAFSTRLFVSLAIIFHAGTAMMLNIAFTHNFLAYAAFINWAMVHEKIKDWTNIRYASVYLLILGLIFIKIAAFAGSWYGIPELKSDLETEQLYIVLLTLPIALGYLSNALWKVLKKFTV